jgi:predicted GIY-YIG superfamily endonuclease
MSFYVYILASRRNGTLYTGMSENLIARVWQHPEGIIPGFTKEYGIKLLVWFEPTRNSRRGPVARAADQEMEPEMEA